MVSELVEAQNLAASHAAAERQLSDRCDTSGLYDKKVLGLEIAVVVPGIVLVKVQASIA